MLNYFKNLKLSTKVVLKNLSWVIIGKVVTILNSLFVGIAIARYLGPENFGLMNYVISYVAMFSIISSFGLDNIEIRELSKGKKNILGTSFLIRFTFSFIVIFIIFITLLIFESDHYTFLLVMIYSLTTLMTPFNVIRNYFTSIMLNEYIVKSEISRTLIGAVIKIILVLTKSPLEYFIIAIFLDSVLISSGYIISYKNHKETFSKWRYDKKISKYLIYQSFPLLISGTLVFIYQKIDVILIKNLIGNASVGYFSAASKITDLAIFIPVIIIQTVTPLLVRLYENDINKYKIKKKQLMDLILWISIFISFVLMVSSKTIILLLYGNDFYDAIQILSIISWKLVFISCFNLSGQFIIIEGLQKLTFIRNLVGCFINLLLNFTLIPKYGVLGASYSVVITFFFSGYFTHIFIKPFKSIFIIQTKSFLNGYKTLFNIKKVL